MAVVVSDRLDAILTSRDHTALDAAVAQCRVAMKTLHPEFHATGLMEPLVREGVAPWYKRFVVLVFMIYSDAVRLWVAEGCVPMRFDPFFFHVQHHLRLYIYQQTETGASIGPQSPPYYAHAFQFVVEMCQCYMNEFDNAGKWLQHARAQGYKSPYD